MMGYLKVQSPGLYSSIQDTGRSGFLSYGVPIGGAMDLYAHKLANLYLQNPQDAATLEITLIGPTVKFTHDTEIVLTGANLSPRLNSIPLLQSVVTQVHAGAVLSFSGRKSGCRAYLGIAGGFQTEVVLGSKSWFEGITREFRLQKTMEIPYISSGNGAECISKDTNAHVNEEELDQQTAIEVFPGPEYSFLTEEQKRALKESSFHISPHNNRMGIQLDERLPNSLNPIVTGPVMPGTVQLTPSGRLIVLMRDCQTTGGYPRVLQLARQGINKLAQRVAGEVKWELCSLL